MDNQQWLSNLLPVIQEHTRASFNLHRSFSQAILEGKVEELDGLSKLFMASFQGLQASTAQLVELHKALESKQLGALHQLTLFKGHVQTIFAHNNELHEGPIPRRQWDSGNSHSIKFRLYFLCECREHTMPTNSKTRHHIHLAKHEGYDIMNHKDFFQRYGTYVLAILKMIRFGIPAANVIVPLSHLISTDAIDQVTARMQLSTETIELGIDQVMSYIEKITTENNELIDVSSGQLESIMTPEDADLRDLESYLKGHDRGAVLGNLNRTLTAEGHVRWVCIDHYRKNHQEKQTNALVDMVKTLEGSFDKSIGCLEVSLESTTKASQLYRALEEAKAVFELKITFYWKLTHNDIKRLRDILAKTSVGILELRLNKAPGPANRPQCYNHIIDIMQLPSIQSFTITGDYTGFIQLFSSLGPNINFPNLRYLKVPLTSSNPDIDGLKCLIEKAPNLSDLVVLNSPVDTARIYSAIAGYQTFPVTFAWGSMRILPPKSGSRQPTVELQHLAQLFEFHGEKIETLVFENDNLDMSTINALAKGTENGSRLKELRLGNIYKTLGNDSCGKLARVVARSELQELDFLVMSDEKARVRILEAIPWKYIRRINIHAREYGDPVVMMKALVDGIKRISGRVVLDRFEIFSMNSVMWTALEEQFQSFLSLTRLKYLDLFMMMSGKQLLSLLQSMDTSRLQHITVGEELSDLALMDALRDAPELQTLRVRGEVYEKEYQVIRNGDKNHFILTDSYL
ncbi:hypothetical protein BGX34_008926 [Mortierella sp. NVP85]|nr:hypothetical protein BGX34_008926 [Mortierella sp. NVP85]